MLDEAGVRAVGGEEHGDAVERRAGPGGVEHGASGEAHLVVGIGGGHDLDATGRVDGPPDLGRSQRVPGDALGDGRHGGVGVGVARDAEQQVHVSVLA